MGSVCGSVNRSVKDSALGSVWSSVRVSSVRDPVSVPVTGSVRRGSVKGPVMDFGIQNDKKLIKYDKSYINKWQYQQFRYPATAEAYGKNMF